jgi:hypothetical protein
MTSSGTSPASAAVEDDGAIKSSLASVDASMKSKGLPFAPEPMRVGQVGGLGDDRPANQQNNPAAKPRLPRTARGDPITMFQSIESIRERGRGGPATLFSLDEALCQMDSMPLKFFRPRPPFLPHIDRSSRCFNTVVLPPAAPMHLGHTSLVLAWVGQRCVSEVIARAI